MRFEDLAAAELAKALLKHRAPIASLHEGLAVLWEEVEGFKEEVFSQHGSRMRALTELAQVAAMATRVAEDALSDILEATVYGPCANCGRDALLAACDMYRGQSVCQDCWLEGEGGGRWA